MPTYEMKCEKCKENVDIKMSMELYSVQSLNGGWQHTDCGGILKRLWSPPGVQIK